MKIGEFNPMDRKFWSAEPEPGFSPERNRMVIETTIKKYEKQVAKKMAEFTDKLRERTDAVATFLKSGKETMGVERYFGKTGLAHLRGEDIRNKLIEQSQMLIKSPERKYQEKIKQKQLIKRVISGKGVCKIIRTAHGKKSKKRKKNI